MPTSEAPEPRGSNAIDTEIQGSGSSDETIDVMDVVPTFKPRKGPGKGGAALQERSKRTALVGELVVPTGGDPVKVAQDHIATLAPAAAKEIEYAVKFGSDQMRYLASRDVMAMNGVTTKPKESGGAPVSMTFMAGSLPIGPTGIPIMPFSNAARRLASNTPDVSKIASTVDGAATPVTIDATATTKETK